ncbi:MAG: phosphoribosylaminoimidazolesuccinocarboxamide synthase [Conexivisphaerales archaeon]|nr:phosphoribosylaminoimidazolesuccinocarboxamide synthase [Conexivisphaerales archaeon]
MGYNGAALGPPSWRGKVKDVYDLGDRLLMVFTDRISAFDSILPDPIPGKGISLNGMSALLLGMSAGTYPNHFLRKVDDRSMEVLKASRIDLELIVRGYIYGSAWRSYSSGNRMVSGVELPPGLRMADELPEPVLTPTTKSQVGHDEEISAADAIGSGVLTRDEWAEVEEASLKLYEFYARVARSRNLILADAKFEFGRTRDGLIQIDEPPTHDSARIWPIRYYEPGVPQEDHCLDKEFLRSYLKRIGCIQCRLPPVVVDQVARRVRGAYEVISGSSRVEDLGLMGLNEVVELAGRELRSGGNP